MCFVWSEREEWPSERDMLYKKRFALASYLSIMGVEGIAQSAWFVQAAHRLALSWIRHVPAKDRMQYDMMLLVTDPYDLLNAEATALLHEVGWILIKVDPLYGIPSDSSYLLQNHYTHTAQFTKLHLWTFERYEHILYLDSDMLVVKNILSAVSGYNTTANTLGVARNRDGSDAFNAGFLYVTPSKTEFYRMRETSLVLKYDTGVQEQGFLNVYWTNRTIYMPADVNQFVDSLTDTCIVMHFVSTLKPWFLCPYFRSGHEKACTEWDSYGHY